MRGYGKTMEGVKQAGSALNNRFGIYCETDSTAFMIARAAEKIGLSIPEDAALLGTDLRPNPESTTTATPDARTPHGAGLPHPDLNAK